MAWRFIAGIEGYNGEIYPISPSPQMHALLDPILAAAGDVDYPIINIDTYFDNPVNPGTLPPGFYFNTNDQNPKHWTGDFTTRTYAGADNHIGYMCGGYLLRLKNVPPDFYFEGSSEREVGIGNPRLAADHYECPFYNEHDSYTREQGGVTYTNPAYCQDIDRVRPYEYSLEGYAQSSLDLAFYYPNIGLPYYNTDSQDDPQGRIYSQTDPQWYRWCYLIINDNLGSVGYITCSHATKTSSQTIVHPNQYRLCCEVSYTHNYYDNAAYRYWANEEREGSDDSWEAIAAVSGDGEATQLAMVKKTALNGGDPVTTGHLNELERILPMDMAKAYFSQSLIFWEAGDTEEKYIKSGNNYMSVTMDSKTSSYEFTFTLDFYMGDGTLIYSHQYTVDHNEMMLGAIRKMEEDDNTRVRVSMIYRPDYQSDGWAWNTEGDYDDANELALYEWFIGEGGGDEDGNINPFDGDDIDGNTQQGGKDWYPRPNFEFGSSGDYRPTNDNLNTDFFHVYAIEDEDLRDLAQELWASTIWDRLKEFYNTPADAIIGLFKIPFDNFYDKNASKVKVRLGDVETYHHLAHEVTDQWPELDCGDVVIKATCGDSYLDLGRYTKMWIYIPFIGEKEIDTNWCMEKFITDDKGDTVIKEGDSGAIINLRLTFDVTTGTIVAKLYINGVVRYQWLGDCHIQMPYSWQTHQAATSQLISTIGAGVGLAAAGLGTAITGGAMLPALVGAGANMAIQAGKLHEANIAGGEVHSAGAIGQTASALCYPFPYITVTYPNVIHFNGQERHIGWGAPSVQKVGTSKGYNKFVSVHLDGIKCTDTERSEIAQILREGVIV